MTNFYKSLTRKYKVVCEFEPTGIVLIFNSIQRLIIYKDRVVGQRDVYAPIETKQDFERILNNENIRLELK